MPVKLKTAAGGSVSLQGHASQSGDTTLTLPNGNGLNTQALTTDGSGNLSWATAGGGGGGGGAEKNLIDNGAMRVYQRAASKVIQPNETASGPLAGDSGHVLVSDRWRAITKKIGGWTISNEADAPAGFSRSQKYLCNSGYANPPSDAKLAVNHRIEGQDLQHLAFGTADASSLTISFWVKANLSGTYVFELHNNDNTSAACATYSYTSGWEKKTLTFSGDTSNGFDDDASMGLILTWWLDAGTDFTSGTQHGSTWGSPSDTDRAAAQTVNLAAQTNNYWQITGVQLEASATASDYAHKKFSDELQRCQRYYEKSYNIATYPGAATYDGIRQAGAMDNTGGMGGSDFTQRLTVAYATRKANTPTVTCWDSAGNSGKVNYPDTTGNITPTLVVNDEGSFSIESASTTGSDHRLYTHFTSAAEI